MVMAAFSLVADESLAGYQPHLTLFRVAEVKTDRRCHAFHEYRVVRSRAQEPVEQQTACGAADADGKYGMWTQQTSAQRGKWGLRSGKQIGAFHGVSPAPSTISSGYGTGSITTSFSFDQTNPSFYGIWSEEAIDCP